ncbi:hypothetical protein PAXRUDRAFT_297898 [Paxillus rubicundulus Ve08.2h10]|uniref:Uncharacterized protein n=1 Tax=Paxillus rubicundulus Ve08.2h10 TaxID=930991 RepID=A0A0D0D5W4_9AGAM|nr:hypothetical protein PAXRUDRAFT_297898 [Paxillus rubicundulus Ve08.2h10]
MPTQGAPRYYFTDFKLSRPYNSSEIVPREVPIRVVTRKCARVSKLERVLQSIPPDIFYIISEISPGKTSFRSMIFLVPFAYHSLFEIM